MEKIFFFIFLLLSVLLYNNPANASSDNKSQSYEEYSPENLSSFVKFLINNGDYYRAHAELDRLVSYYPAYISPITFNVTESYLFYKSRRYCDILKLNNMAVDGNFLCALNLFRIDSLLKSGIHGNEQVIDELMAYQCPDSQYAEYYNKRKIYYSILNSYNKDLHYELSQYAEFGDSFKYAENLESEKKSPFIGALSGIIPGMGYIYAGETGTGIVAFIVIAAGSAITWGAHANDIEPLAAVSGAATFFMYSGSIAGGYMQTVKYNRGLSEKLILRLDRDFMLDKDIDDIYIKCGIESNVR